MRDRVRDEAIKAVEIFAHEKLRKYDPEFEWVLGLMLDAFRNCPDELKPILKRIKADIGRELHGIAEPTTIEPGTFNLSPDAE